MNRNILNLHTLRFFPSNRGFIFDRIRHRPMADGDLHPVLPHWELLRFPCIIPSVKGEMEKSGVTMSPEMHEVRVSRKGGVFETLF